MKSLVCWGWWIIEPSGGTQWQTGRRGWVCVWVCVIACLHLRSSVIYMCASVLLTGILTFKYLVFGYWTERKCARFSRRSCGAVELRPADRILYCHLSVSNRNWINSTLSKDNTHCLVLYVAKHGDRLHENKHETFKCFAGWRVDVMLELKLQLCCWRMNLEEAAPMAHDFAQSIHNHWIHCNSYKGRIVTKWYYPSFRNQSLSFRSLP